MNWFVHIVSCIIVVGKILEGHIVRLKKLKKNCGGSDKKANHFAESECLCQQ